MTQSSSYRVHLTRSAKPEYEIIRTPEQCRRISISATRRAQDNYRKVCVKGTVYANLQVAARETGMSARGIQRRIDSLKPEYDDFFFLRSPKHSVYTKPPRQIPKIFLPNKYAPELHPDPDMELDYTVGVVLANVLGTEIHHDEVKAIIAQLKNAHIHLAL